MARNVFQCRLEQTAIYRFGSSNTHEALSKGCEHELIAYHIFQNSQISIYRLRLQF